MIAVKTSVALCPIGHRAWHSFKAERMSSHILVCENLFNLMGLHLLCLYSCLKPSANNLGVSLHCAG